MALYFDVTKTASARQLSGLTRVSRKLMHALGSLLGTELIPVVWVARRRYFRCESHNRVLTLTERDVFLTPEVFSSDDRPGYFKSLEDSGVFSAAVFHDAIPIHYPEITWPKSVARHPQYLQNLSRFDHVFSVSLASQQDLLAQWGRMGVEARPSLSTINLGADFFERSEVEWTHEPQLKPLLLNVGIIEPRKNQKGLLEQAIRCWDDGLAFELHFVGRINPHFGKPIEKRIRQAKKTGYPVFLHSKQSDTRLLDLYSKARFTLFNSIAEGFGLPVVESLWLGVPCISRALPSLTHLGEASGCRFFESDDEINPLIRDWLANEDSYTEAVLAARASGMGTWDVTAETLWRTLEKR